MEKTPVTISAYLSGYDQLLKRLNGGNDSRRIAMRDRAISFFKENGFPTTKDEAWRYTDIKPLTSQVFDIKPMVDPDEKLIREVSSHLFKNWDGLQFVFIDGQFSEELSEKNTAQDKGILIQNLNSLPDQQQKQLTSVIERSPAKTDNAFSALNTALFNDGIWIDIPGSMDNKLKIHILNFCTAREKNSATYPRHFINVGANSSLQLIESYMGVDRGVYFRNVVTDIELAENTKIHHCKIQNENLSAFHMAHTYVHQKRASDYQACSFTSGGEIARNNVHVILEGEQCETGLDGLYLGHKNQLIDNQTLIDHAMPHCHSREVYRGILADKARGVFSGKIMVRPDAQKTDAEQNNGGLLLSEDAKIDTKPQLEIYADDVKCTHGATVGQLDEQALFYLQSRGIGEQKARNMLIYAFAEEIIENIQDEQVKDKIEALILNRLEDDMQFHKNGAV